MNGQLVALIRSKDGKRTYEIRKIAKNDWSCTCGQKSKAPCRHKLALWQTWQRKEIPPAGMQILAPEAL